jgi:hypothetical protein
MSRPPPCTMMRLPRVERRANRSSTSSTPMRRNSSKSYVLKRPLKMLSVFSAAFRTTRGLSLMWAAARACSALTRICSCSSVRVLAVRPLLALANCSTLAADFQRILHTSRVAVFIAASRENCARRDAEGMLSSCPARGSGDHEGAPKRPTSYFHIFIFSRIDRQNRSQVPRNYACKHGLHRRIAPIDNPVQRA